MKKIIPTLLAFALIFCFAACGETDSVTPSDSSTDAPTESSVSTDTSESKPEESSASDDASTLKPEESESADDTSVSNPQDSESSDNSQTTENPPPDSEAADFSAGLQYTQSSDKTCYTVSGIGSCEDADVAIPSSNEGLPVIGIDKMAFHECVNLSSIKIADGMTTIGEWAFYTCTNLKSITIPSSLTSIDERALYYCTSLEEIHYDGTKEQWNAISKGESWNDRTGAYTIFCTDGEIAK